MGARTEYNRAYKKQLRAEGRLKTIAIELYGEDIKLWEHAAATGSISGYIKELIRRDMQR